jgi:hypothetical protein
LPWWRHISERQNKLASSRTLRREGVPSSRFHRVAGPTATNPLWNLSITNFRLPEVIAGIRYPVVFRATGSVVRKALPLGLRNCEYIMRVRPGVQRRIPA